MEQVSKYFIHPEGTQVALLNGKHIFKRAI